MAKLPGPPEALIESYGPHPIYAPPGGWQDESRHPADRLVKTHCCFCGQQCGIQLLVKDNQVIGFEPWMDFPFNQGKLCPKGVKRYLQGAHPDRLLHAYERDASSPGGFRSVGYDRAVARVAAEIERIQSDVEAIANEAARFAEESAPPPLDSLMRDVYKEPADA